MSVSNSSLKKKRKTLSKDEVKQLTREDLELHVLQLTAHNIQLQALLKRTLANSQGKITKHAKDRPFNFDKHSQRHVLFMFAYLGWDYQGYAVQEDTLNTIENILFDALHKTKLIEDRKTSNYHRCGRTDKGVSAFSQVVSLTVRSMGEGKDEIPYVELLNRVLPKEVQMLAWCPIPDDFSARFDCCSRTYKYFFPSGSLNLEKMQEAGKLLEGCHDFRNLCKMDVGNGVINFIRRIDSVTATLLLDDCPLDEFVPFSSNNEVRVQQTIKTSIAEEKRDNLGNLCSENTSQEQIRSGFEMCVITIKSKAFLWHQIRAIMAVLLLVGEGNEEPCVVSQLLDVESNPRKPQYSLASELPLCLFASEYPDTIVQWQYSAEALKRVHADLQHIWAEHAIKCSMIRRMLRDVTCRLTEQHSIESASASIKAPETSSQVLALNRQHSCLTPSAQPRQYKPLLERHTCESLEQKVEHFVKRQRLDANILDALPTSSAGHRDTEDNDAS